MGGGGVKLGEEAALSSESVEGGNLSVEDLINVVWACTLACRMDDESLHHLLTLSKGLLESLPLPLLVQVLSLLALLALLAQKCKY